MIRFATIGSGKIVEQFLTEAKKHPEFQLAAVYSRTPERAAGSTAEKTLRSCVAPSASEPS